MFYLLIQRTGEGDVSPINSPNRRWAWSFNSSTSFWCMERAFYAFYVVTVAHIYQRESAKPAGAVTNAKIQPIIELVDEVS